MILMTPMCLQNTSSILKAYFLNELATVNALATVDLSFDDEPTVNSKDELTAATSG